MYRWQDPAPAAVQAIRTRRSARPARVENDKRVKVIPVMWIDDVAYAEAPEIMVCDGCAFDDDEMKCDQAHLMAPVAFGDVCGERRVIYIKA